MKYKMNKIKLLYKIGLCSCTGFIGIIGWCVVSLDMGGRGMTPSLLFSAYILLLFACTSVSVASDTDIRHEYGEIRKICMMTKNKFKTKRLDILEHRISTAWKVKVLFSALFSLLVTTLVKGRSTIMAVLVYVAFFSVFNLAVTILWNRKNLKDLRKFRKEMDVS